MPPLTGGSVCAPRAAAVRFVARLRLGVALAAAASCRAQSALAAVRRGSGAAVRPLAACAFCSSGWRRGFALTVRCRGSPRAGAAAAGATSSTALPAGGGSGTAVGGSHDLLARLLALDVHGHRDGEDDDRRGGGEREIPALPAGRHHERRRTRVRRRGARRRGSRRRGGAAAPRAGARDSASKCCRSSAHRPRRFQFRHGVAQAALRRFLAGAGDGGDLRHAQPAFLVQQEGFALRRRQRLERLQETRQRLARLGLPRRIGALARAASSSSSATRVRPFARQWSTSRLCAMVYSQVVKRAFGA